VDREMLIIGKYAGRDKNGKPIFKIIRREKQ
jgi:hypothetical protein